jgi:hypothetical protein
VEFYARTANYALGETTLCSRRCGGKLVRAEKCRKQAMRRGKEDNVFDEEERWRQLWREDTKRGSLFFFSSIQFPLRVEFIERQGFGLARILQQAFASRIFIGWREAI